MTDDPHADKAQIIDISSIQYGIEWDKVRDSGLVHGVYIQATGPASGRFVEHVTGAASVQLPIGGYEYVRFATPVADQVRAFADRVYDLTLPPMIDFEQDGNLTPDQCCGMVKELVAGLLEALGVMPILYTYPGFWARMGKAGLDPDWAKLDLWIAQYTSAMQPTVPLPWGTWSLWQWAASDPHGPLGHVAGIPGLVDRSRFNGDVAAFRTWAGLGSIDA